MKQAGGAHERKEDEEAEEFTTRLADYLTEKYNESFEVPPRLEDDPNLWYVRSPSILAIHEFRDEKGKTYVESYDLLNLDYLFEEDVVDNSSDVARFLMELKDRNNWDYLARRVCPHVVAYLTWADGIAKRASEQKKADVEHWFPSIEYPALRRSGFRAVINTKGMTDDEKINAIDKHIPAVIKAYDLASDQKSWEAFMQDFVKKAKFGTTKS